MMNKGVRIARVGMMILMSLVVLAVYLAVSYVLGGEYLQTVMGSDTAAFLVKVKQLESSFPNYAFWNPQDGAGVVLPHAYPILIHSVIIGLTKISIKTPLKRPDIGNR